MPESSLPEAASLGALDAAEQFGVVKEAWAGLIGAGLGAAGGALLSDRDERMQGAVLGGLAGGLGGWGLGKGVGAVAHALPRAQTAIQSIASPGIEERLRQMALDAPLRSRALVNYGNEQFKNQKIKQRLPTRNSQITPQTPNPQGAWAPEWARSAGQWVRSKFSSYNLGTRIPGTPFQISERSYDERLPGMHRWVPRDVIERTHEGLDTGLDPADVIQTEVDRGSVIDPLIGAGAGAALARFGLGGKGMAMAGGALLGAGAGALYNRFTAPIRQRDATESMLGVLGERGRESSFPLRGQTHSTANEATPMVISSGANIA